MKPPQASAKESDVVVSLDGVDVRSLTIEQAQHFEVKLSKAIKDAVRHRVTNHRLVFLPCEDEEAL